MPCLEFHQKNSQYLIFTSISYLSTIQVTPIQALKKGSRGKWPIWQVCIGKVQEAGSRTAGWSPSLCSGGADNWRRGPVPVRVDFQPVVVLWSEMIDSDVVGAVPVGSSYTPEKWMSITDCVPLSLGLLRQNDPVRRQASIEHIHVYVPSPGGMGRNNPWFRLQKV